MERTALLAALLLDRPLCVDCIAAKMRLTESEIAESVTRIRRTIVLREYVPGRCRACGEHHPVFVLEYRSVREST